MPESAIAVDKAALLKLVRTLDGIDRGHTKELLNAMDKLRLAFTPDEIATGVIT